MDVSARKPFWLKRGLPTDGRSSALRSMIRDRALYTVCSEAHCPNRWECFSRGTATFLLLGPNCTRNCTFCSVDNSPVCPPDLDEPRRIADTAAQMGLSFFVVTMVTRDDLPDGGAGHIVGTVKAIREKCPGVGLELLISDLGGNWDALAAVLESQPDVINHNLETCPRLYAQVRPQAEYQRSLELLKRSGACAPRVITKSGLMLGMGETKQEVLSVLDDLREAGCLLLTLGQYLAPSMEHHSVFRYVTPEEFKEFQSEAIERGFAGVASAPLVRSSYMAEGLYRTALHRFYSGQTACRPKGRG